MRTTIIPAQITTVEDKIAGNLNLTQILILMVPVFITAVVFVLIPPTMKLVGYKLILILFFSVVCLILALRIKGRVLFNWLLILSQFKLRPKIFVFNKNDNYLREMEIEVVKKKTKAKETNVIKIISQKEQALVEAETIKFLHFIEDKNNRLSFKLSDKGGLNVAFEQSKK
jgi:GTPase SAR1 family protein